MNPSVELTQLLKTIESKAGEKSSDYKSLDDFRKKMLNYEKRNTVGIVTSIIEQGRIELALGKIKEYRVSEFGSGFGFGETFDLKFSGTNT